MAASEQPFFVKVRACAIVFGVTAETIREWIRRGELRAVQFQFRHYTDERPRKSAQGQWMVEVTSVESLFARMYAGEPIPPGAARRLRSLAHPLPGKSP